MDCDFLRHLFLRHYRFKMFTKFLRTQPSTSSASQSNSSSPKVNFAQRQIVVQSNQGVYRENHARSMNQQHPSNLTRNAYSEFSETLVNSPLSPQEKSKADNCSRMSGPSFGLPSPHCESRNFVQLSPKFRATNNGHKSPIFAFANSPQSHYNGDGVSSKYHDTIESNVQLTPDPDCAPMNLTGSSDSGSSKVHYENPILPKMTSAVQAMNEKLLPKLKESENFNSKQNWRGMLNCGKRTIEIQQSLNEAVPLLQSNFVEFEEECDSSEPEASPEICEPNAVANSSQSGLIRARSKFTSTEDDAEPDWMRSYGRPATVENECPGNVPSNSSNEYPPNRKQDLRYELIAMFREQQEAMKPQTSATLENRLPLSQENGLPINAISPLAYNWASFGRDDVPNVHSPQNTFTKPVHDNPLVKRRARMANTPVHPNLQQFSKNF